MSTEKQFIADLIGKIEAAQTTVAGIIGAEDCDDKELKKLTSQINELFKLASDELFKLASEALDAAASTASSK